MLIAISGSQGSGKTTVLKQLKRFGFPIVERKTSRSILTDWGVTLSQVNNDHELTVKFQNEILARKHEDEFEAVNSKEIWFTERSYADLFTYALVSLGKDNEYSDFINSYYVHCFQNQPTYSAVIYLNAGLFTVEHDGVRGSNQYYSKMVDLTMREFTEQMTPQNLFVIDEAHNAARLLKVYQTIANNFPYQMPFKIAKEFDQLSKVANELDDLDRFFDKADKVFDQVDKVFEQSEKVFDEASKMLDEVDDLVKNFNDVGC